MDSQPFVARPAGAAPARPRLGGELFGPLAALLADPAVTDVFVNGPGPVWADHGRGPEPQRITMTESEARELAVALVAAGGRHIDEATPCVDVRLGEGIRVHAVLPPIGPGTLLSIRVPRPSPLTIGQLEADGLFEVVGLDTVRALVARRANLLITGAGGCGNTTWHL